MINAHSVNEARVTLERASTEPGLPSVSDSAEPTEQTGKVWGPGLGQGVGGCPQARATARMFHARDLHPKLRKQQENYKISVYFISRIFCLMLFPTGVSGHNINQAWHKGKCSPGSVSLSLPLLVVTNSLIFLKFSKEVFFFLTSFLHTSKQLNLTRVSYEENQMNSSNV